MRLKNLGHKLLAINALRRTTIWKAGGDTGACRGQMRVLHCILCNPGWGQKDIAEALYISPAAVADICKRLEQDGLLRRDVDSDNRRCKVLIVTEKGEEADRRHGEIFKMVDEQTFAGMTEEELSTLDNLLTKILDNLDGNQENPMQVFAAIDGKDIKEVK